MAKKCFLLLFIAVFSFVYSQDKESLSSIDKKDLKMHLSFLASDEMQGRITPSPELDVAAKYIAIQFEKYGLKPGGDSGTYFQNFTVYYKHYKEISLSIGGKKYDKTSELLPPVFEGLETPSCNIKSQVVFAGYGITEETINYNDYENIDVKGKIVLLLRGSPKFENLPTGFSPSKLQKWNSAKAKIENAKKNGAAALIIASTSSFVGLDLFENAYILSPNQKASMNPVRKIAETEIPVIVMNEKVLSRIFSSLGKDLNVVKKIIVSNLKPQSFNLSEHAEELVIDKIISSANTKNVIGIIEGSDKDFKDECIVIGAHYDHVGSIDGMVFNGSDDNASGAVGVMELAEAFKKGKTKPKRSIIFIAFTGEEQGLYGSNYYVSHPVIPLDKTKAMINFDMISRDEDTQVDNPVALLMGVPVERKSAVENRNTLYLYGLSFSPGLKEVFISANKNVQLDLKMDRDTSNLFQGSDHIPFYRKKIPVCFFNTGMHPDLHLSTDDVEKSNFDKMERIVKLAYYVVFDLVNKKGDLKLGK